VRHTKPHAAKRSEDGSRVCNTASYIDGAAVRVRSYACGCSKEVTVHQTDPENCHHVSWIKRIDHKTHRDKAEKHKGNCNEKVCVSAQYYGQLYEATMGADTYSNHNRRMRNTWTINATSAPVGTNTAAGMTRGQVRLFRGVHEPGDALGQ
jgi:hypothetical protein